MAVNILNGFLSVCRKGGCPATNMLKWPVLTLTDSRKFRNIDYNSLFDKRSRHETYQVTLQLTHILITKTPLQSIGFLNAPIAILKRNIYLKQSIFMVR
jgi:hypothetical protein